jgi:hypothetical protein
MTAFNTSMFQSIKAALSKNEEGNTPALYNEILKTTPGNTYTLRLLPYQKDPSKTFHHYYVHGWNSFATGQYVQAVSPQTFNERDPISEERFRVLRTGTEEQKEKMSVVRRAEKWLVNVYVVDDSGNPANNGTVKILRYGKQLHKIIMDAIEGDDAEEFGARIFDLGPDGVNFKVKVEQQGEYPTYVSSRFTTAGKLSLSEDAQEKIYRSVFNLHDVYQVKSYDDLKQMINDHIYCVDSTPSTAIQTAASSTQPPWSSSPVTVTTSSVSESVSTGTSIEDDIDELLKDL